MDTLSDLLWFELFALAFGLFGWFVSFKSLKKARLIEDTPTSKIRSAPQGYIEIMGTTRDLPDGESLRARLTGTPCVWYAYEIEKYQSSGKHSRWRTIEKKASKTPILLDDGTGACHIHPDRADVTPSLKKVWHGSSRYPTSTRSGGLFGRRYRYTEQRIHAGQTLYALGHFETLHPPSLAEQTRTAMAELINQWKQDYDALIARFDRDGNSDIDLREWEEVRAAAGAKAAAEAREQYDHTPVNVMAYSPGRRQPFLLSTHNPEKLSQRYRWHFIGFGALAFACTLAFFYFFPAVLQAWTAR